MYQIEENRNIKLHYMILALIFDKKGKKKKKKKWLFSGVNTLKGQEIHIHFLASRLDSIFRRQVEQKSLNIMLIQEMLGNI